MTNCWNRFSSTQFAGAASDALSSHPWLSRSLFCNWAVSCRHSADMLRSSIYLLSYVYQYVLLLAGPLGLHVELVAPPVIWW